MTLILLVNMSAVIIKVSNCNTVDMFYTAKTCLLKRTMTFTNRVIGLHFKFIITKPSRHHDLCNLAKITVVVSDTVRNIMFLRQLNTFRY